MRPASEPAEAGYRLLDHPADIGVVAWGPTPGRAFAEAARGMFAIMLGERTPRGPSEQFAVHVEGEDWPVLLVNWLSELLFRFEADRLVPAVFHMVRCWPPACGAQVEACQFHPDEWQLGIGIKAVTYHQLVVDVAPRRTDLQVIFDV